MLDENGNEVAEVVETPEAKAEALAAQMEGFSGAAPATTDKVAPAKADDTAKTDAAAEAEKVAQEVKAVEVAKVEAANPGLTDAQIDALVTKKLAGVYGKFGGIEQKLAALSGAKVSGVSLTEEDVDDLKTEYGPEMAAAMLKVFNKFGQKIGAVSPAQAEVSATEERQAVATAEEAKRVADANAKVVAEQAANLQILAEDHPDWKAVIRTANDKDFKPEFVKWAEKLTPADKRKLFNSWDMDFLSNKITEYKAYTASLKVVKPVTPAPVVKTVPNRLAAATPAAKSVPGTVPTKSALDEQLEGYRSV